VATPVEPVHLRPATELAERVLLPGDPHRALWVAQALLERPLMFNHHRGLWGYTGLAPDGAPVSVQSTGMGGPTTAIVVEELIALGARRLIRIGTCGALDPALALGQMVTVTAALAGDGTSAALGARDAVEPDPRLTAALLAGEARPGVVAASTDLFYERRPGVEARWRERGAGVVEMEAATLLQVCLSRGVQGACVLAVSDLLSAPEGRRRIEADALEELGVRLGRAGLAALTVPARAP
jgi:uridine phosphorylase